MGRKKKKVQKPQCWYCERVFEDEKILIQHQKAKHFKCHVCHKKLGTAGGLVIHVAQVHKETIDKVPNAKPGRDSVKPEIYGMEGVPSTEEEGESPAKKQKLGAPPSAAPAFAGLPPAAQTGGMPAPMRYPPAPGGPPMFAPPYGAPWPGAPFPYPGFPMPPPGMYPPPFPPGMPSYSGTAPLASTSSAYSTTSAHTTATQTTIQAPLLGQSPAHQQPAQTAATAATTAATSTNTTAASTTAAPATTATTTAKITFVYSDDSMSMVRTTSFFSFFSMFFHLHEWKEMIVCALDDTFTPSPLLPHYFPLCGFVSPL
ncbi:SUPPRESSOR OF FRI 4 isoform X2 [Balamuthia mandrillaris]